MVHLVMACKQGYNINSLTDEYKLIHSHCVMIMNIHSLVDCLLTFLTDR